VPEDYEEAGYYDLHPEADGFSSKIPQGWNPGGVYGEDLSRCDHCGASLLYGCILLHKPTGQHIHVGETCMGNRFTRSKAQFQAMRKAHQLDRQAAEARVKAAQYRDAHADVDWVMLAECKSHFVQDVLGKLNRYGDISDRQLEAIVKAAVQQIERDAVKATEVRVPVPTGKGIVIEGEVVSMKTQENDYGTREVMTVKVTDSEGAFFLVWGTVPSSLEGSWGVVEYCPTHAPVATDGEMVGMTCQECATGYVGMAHKGDTVRFTANLEASDKDESFGFFKRPRKAEVVK
jgi:hypothetical protein